MTDLTDHVADAIFMEIDFGGPPGRQDCEAMATVALQAARAQGWRIVKTQHARAHGLVDHEIVTEEWTGG